MSMVFKLRFISIVLLCGLLLQSCATQSPSTLLHQAKIEYAQGKYAHAYNKLIKLAKQGNGDAQYAIGYMQYYGLGTDQDNLQARDWLKKSARQGNEDAKRALGLLQTSRDINVSQGSTIRHNPSIAKQTLPQQALKVSDLDWLRHQKPEAYTIRLLTEKEPTTINAIKQRSNHQRRMADYRFIQNGIIRYGLAYGVFPSKAAAEKTAKTLKMSLQRTAKVTQFNTIQDIMLP